jgi:aspartate kinase
VERRLGEDLPIVFEVVDEGGWAVVTVPEVPRGTSGWALIFRALAGAGIQVDIVSSPPASAAGGETGAGERHDLSFVVRRGDVPAAVEALDGPARDLGCGTVRSDDCVRRVTVFGRDFRSAEGYAASCFAVCAAAGVRFGLVSVSDTRLTVVGDPRSAEALRTAFAPDAPGLALAL